jgi:hypothetical protein
MVSEISWSGGERQGGHPDLEHRYCQKFRFPRPGNINQANQSMVDNDYTNPRQTSVTREEHSISLARTSRRQVGRMGRAMNELTVVVKS